jgi:NADPH-dependent 2,4-dienoyl-CoA reductase/sulfur reductase-like enzyme
MSRLVIIGGSDAGTSAALRAREIDPSAEVTVVMSDSFPNYSICGLPFYLSGEVPDWHRLAHRTAEEITGTGIRLLLEHAAQTIDPLKHVVTIVARNGQVEQLRYDRLVIATGAVPIRPPIRGLDLAGVDVLRSMEDSFAVHTWRPFQDGGKVLAC